MAKCRTVQVVVTANHLAKARKAREMGLPLGNHCLMAQAIRQHTKRQVSVGFSGVSVRAGAGASTSRWWEFDAMGNTLRRLYDNREYKELERELPITVTCASVFSESK